MIARAAMVLVLATVLSAAGTARADEQAALVGATAADFVGFAGVRAVYRQPIARARMLAVLVGIRPADAPTDEETASARTILYVIEANAPVAKYVFPDHALGTSFGERDEWQVSARLLAEDKGTWVAVTRGVRARTRHGSTTELQLAVVRFDGQALALEFERPAVSRAEDSQDGGSACVADVRVIDPTHRGNVRIVAHEVSERLHGALPEGPAPALPPPKRRTIVYRKVGEAYVGNQKSLCGAP